MKISTYNPVASASITLPSGHASASSNINAYGGKTDISSLNNLMKFATKIQEDKDAQAAFNAMNDYNQQMNELLYNKENGLMHLQGSAAENMGQTYADAEKKIRENVLGTHKVMMRGAQTALSNSLEKIATGHSRSIMEHEYKQGEIAKDVTLANGKNSFSMSAQKMFSNPESVSAFAGLYAMQVGERYKDFGEERIQAEMRKAQGDIYKAAMNEALAKEDFNAYNNLLTLADPFLEAGDRANLDKVSHIKQRGMYERNLAQEAFAMFGTDKRAAYEHIKQNMGRSSGGSSNVEKVRALIGKVPFWADDGTNCVRTFGIALKGTPYEGIINTVPMIETARQNGQLIPFSPEAAQNARPGDIFIGDGGNGDEIGHAVMKTEKGVIQNGASGFNGKGGIYEKDIPPEQMLNSVKWIVRTSDYNSSGSGGGYNPESEDRIKRQYDRLYSEQQSIKQAEKLNIYNEVTDYIENAIMGQNGPQMTLAQAQEWGRQYAGNDLNKLKETMKVINSTYKIYGINTTKGGQTLDMLAIDKVLPKFTSPNDLRDWCAEYGFNATQTKQVLDRYKQYFNKTGDFSIPWKDLEKELIGTKPTPRDRIRWQGAVEATKAEMAKAAKYEDMVANPAVARTFLKKALKEKPYYRGMLSSNNASQADIYNIGGYDFEMDEANGRVILYNRDGSVENLSKEDFEARIENGR